MYWFPFSVQKNIKQNTFSGWNFADQILSCTAAAHLTPYNVCFKVYTEKGGEFGVTQVSNLARSCTDMN